MNLLLINPSLFPAPKRLHLGLTLLASEVNHTGRHRAQIVDFLFHRKNWSEYMRRRIEESGADVVGVNCNTLLMHHADMVIHAVRRSNAGAHCMRRATRYVKPGTVFRKARRGRHLHRGSRAHADRVS